MKQSRIWHTIHSTTFSSRSLSNVANESSLEYCTNIVRRYDHENFLATLLMTKSIRSPALVVRAFNVEIAKVQDNTSDPQTAAFRLQFWQDTLNSIYKKGQTIRNVPANPIAQELFKVCTSYNLPRRHLEKLITSRNALLKNRHFRSLEDLEKYADDTVSTVYHLLLSIAGVMDVHADHAASHLGKAQGIANILRSVHVSNQHKMVSLPMDLLMQHKLSQESVLRGVDSEDMRNVSFDVASRANSHLEKARKIQVPKLVNQILLPATAVDSFLKRLQKCHFNVFDRSLLRASATLPFSFYYNRLVNKF